VRGVKGGRPGRPELTNKGGKGCQSATVFPGANREVVKGGHQKGCQETGIQRGTLMDGLSRNTEGKDSL